MTYFGAQPQPTPLADAAGCRPLLRSPAEDATGPRPHPPTPPAATRRWLAPGEPRPRQGPHPPRHAAQRQPPQPAFPPTPLRATSPHNAPPTPLARGQHGVPDGRSCGGGRDTARGRGRWRRRLLVLVLRGGLGVQPGAGQRDDRADERLAGERLRARRGGAATGEIGLSACRASSRSSGAGRPSPPAEPARSPQAGLGVTGGRAGGAWLAWWKKKTEEKMMATRLTTLHTPWLTGLTRSSVLNANWGAREGVG
jgi:hypothetical protein